MTRWVWACALMVAAAALVGCEKKRAEATRARVSGKVMFDGKPLATGTVLFDAGNGEPPGAFTVLDGAYDGLAAVGKNKVKLTAFRKISMKEKMKMDGPGYDTMVDENLLPQRYADGTIVKEVVADGPNTFDFDLKSK